MTAAILAARRDTVAYRAEDEAVTRAEAVLGRALSADYTWDSGDAIRRARAGLADCLAERAALLDGTRHPVSVFPDLDGRRDDALDTALKLITEDIAAWTDDLVLSVRETAGDEAADYVNGINEGEKAA